jgi:hypothetical protein
MAQPIKATPILYDEEAKRFAERVNRRWYRSRSKGNAL